MMTYQMEHFVVRKTVSISTIRNNGSGMLLQNVICILGKRILEPSVSSLWFTKERHKVINYLLCIETLCN